MASSSAWSCTADMWKPAWARTQLKAGQIDEEGHTQ